MMKAIASATLSLLLCFAAFPAAGGAEPPQDPTPVVNGVYVPDYKGTPGVKPGETPVTPLQTELIGPLDIARLRPGSPVLAKLDVAWTGRGCALRAGSMLSGHIAEVDPRTKQNRVSRVTVLFDKADCNGPNTTAFPATLVAVLAGTLGGDPDLTEGTPLADAVGLAINGGIRSAGTASAITDYSPLPVRKLPANVVPGQVVGLSRVKLSVGSGVDGGSVLSSPNHDLRLEATTHFILMPHAAAANTVAAAASRSGAAGMATAAATVAALPSPPPPVDETEVCTAACSTTGGSDALVATPVSMTSLPTKVLGYSPREKREVTSFGYDATLTYLDANNLLFTFDPHKLRERGGGFLQQGTRVVRAVLVEPSTQKVKRILDWRVQGEGRYIWRVGNDRLLVHVGRQLRLFGPDLVPIRSVTLPGPLAWISAAPTGNHFAVGIYDERHSPEMHRQILDVTGEDPEEDIDIHVYDGDLNLLLTTLRSTATYPPVLSDLGEIRVRSLGHARWQISEYRWDRTELSIAKTTSSCRPRVSSSLEGYLFVVGCESTPGVRWYRMLRPDGHPVLKGQSPSEEIEQASSSIAPGEFAVRVVKVLKPMLPGQPFSKTDIAREEITVYRSSDGRRLFSTTATEVPMAEQSFAISPSGRQVALIGDATINFYSVAAKAVP